MKWVCILYTFALVFLSYAQMYFFLKLLKFYTIESLLNQACQCSDKIQHPYWQNNYYRNTISNKCAHTLWKWNLPSYTTHGECENGIFSHNYVVLIIQSVYSSYGQYTDSPGLAFISQVLSLVKVIWTMIKGTWLIIRQWPDCKPPKQQWKCLLNVSIYVITIH